MLFAEIIHVDFHTGKKHKYTVGRIAERINVTARGTYDYH